MITNKQKILELENSLCEKGYEMKLLTKDNAIVLIQELHNNNIPICGFDGFNVGGNIKVPEGWDTNVKHGSVQPEQDFSRDYSKYTAAQSYSLCLEYFSKDRSQGTLYELAYSRD